MVWVKICPFTTLTPHSEKLHLPSGFKCDSEGSFTSVYTLQCYKLGVKLVSQLPYAGVSEHKCQGT